VLASELTRCFRLFFFFFFSFSQQCELTTLQKKYYRAIYERNLTFLRAGQTQKGNMPKVTDQPQPFSAARPPSSASSAVTVAH
jgi:hypothetical protein